MKQKTAAFKSVYDPLIHLTGMGGGNGDNGGKGGFGGGGGRAQCREEIWYVDSEVQCLEETALLTPERRITSSGWRARYD